MQIKFDYNLLVYLQIVQIISFQVPWMVVLIAFVITNIGMQLSITYKYTELPTLNDNMGTYLW